jgi:hypothetical protein
MVLLRHVGFVPCLSTLMAGPVRVRSPSRDDEHIMARRRMSGVVHAVGVVTETCRELHLLVIDFSPKRATTLKVERPSSAAGQSVSASRALAHA